MVTKAKTGKAKISDEKLAAMIKAQGDVVSSGSKSTIINRWAAGRALTESQFKEVKGQVDPTTVKKFTEQRAQIDNKTHQFIGYKDVTLYVNKQVVRIDNAIKADKLDDGAVASMSLYESVNQADLEGKNIDLYMQKSKLSSLKAEFQNREVARKTKAMEKLGLQVQSLKEIYENAVAAKTLEEADQVDAEAENTLVITA